MVNIVAYHVVNFNCFSITAELKWFNRQFNVYGTTLSAEVGFYLHQGNICSPNDQQFNVSGDTSSQSYRDNGVRKGGRGMTGEMLRVSLLR
jgi:hypothetical protein